MTTSIEKRIAVEKKVVRHLVKTMAEHGWKAIGVDDGGDELEPVTATNDKSVVKSVVEAVFAVDEARIYFENANGVTHWAFIVLGNSGWDCIADYSYGPENKPDTFESIMTKFVDPYTAKLEAA